MEVKTYGIDLGTTYSAISYLDDNGQPQIIHNPAHGSDLLASAVYFQEDGEPVVGTPAKEEAELNPHRVIQFIKREIGKADSTPKEFDGKEYNAIQISAIILKQIANYANEQGHNVKNVVITCPAYFGEQERQATKQAADLAGLNVLNIINEPTAAAYNYLSKEYKESRKILVYDLGGGTFDVSYIDYKIEGEKTFIDVVCSEGSDKLGGADWDEVLFNHMKELFINDDSNDYDEDGFDEDLDIRQSVRSKVEDVKQVLSTKPKASAKIEKTRLNIERANFEQLTKPLLNRTVNVVKSILQKANATENDIDLVLLVGGSTLMPQVREMIKSMFDENKVRVEEPNFAVAKGAALYAAAEANNLIESVLHELETVKDISKLDEETKEKLERFTSENLIKADKPKEILNKMRVSASSTISTAEIVERLPYSVGISVRNSETNEIFIDNLLFKGDKIPCEITETYYVPDDNMTEIRSKLYENRLERGEPPIILIKSNGSDNPIDETVKVLGDLVEPVPKGTKKGADSEVFIRAETGGFMFKGKIGKGKPIEIFIKSDFTMSKEELHLAKQDMATINPTGDI